MTIFYLGFSAVLDQEAFLGFEANFCITEEVFVGAFANWACRFYCDFYF